MISWDLAPWKETLTVLGSCSSTPADTSAALRALWWPPRVSMEFPAATARMSCKSAVRSATEHALLGPLKRTRCDWKKGRVFNNMIVVVVVVVVVVVAAVVVVGVFVKL